MDNYNVSSTKLGPLKQFMPKCNCNGTYTVFTTPSFSDENKISRVHIICNSCGRETKTNVSRYSIYQKDLKF